MKTRSAQPADVHSVRGAKVAFANPNNMIAGHPIDFVVEDDGCSAEGGQTAATKLAANPEIVIVLGPACSSAAPPGAPILWKAGVADIGTAASAPSLERVQGDWKIVVTTDSSWPGLLFRPETSLTPVRRHA
jgi:ABC-type branched-subunit amino acid transport system substrate-binding protein